MADETRGNIAATLLLVFYVWLHFQRWPLLRDVWRVADGFRLFPFVSVRRPNNFRRKYASAILNSCHVPAFS
jgi:hypothetical protein